MPSETLTLLAITQTHTDIKREPISRLLASAGPGCSSLSVGDPLGPPQAGVGSPLLTTLPPAGRALFDMFSWSRSSGWRFPSPPPTLFGVCLERFLLDGAPCRWFFGRSGRGPSVWFPRSVRRTFHATLLLWFGAGDSSPLRFFSFSTVVPSSCCFALFTASFLLSLAAASLPEFHFPRLRFDLGRFFDLELALQCFLHFLWDQALDIGDAVSLARANVSPLVGSVGPSVWTGRSSTLAPSAGNRQSGQRRRPAGSRRQLRPHLPLRNVLLQLLPLLSLCLPPVLCWTSLALMTERYAPEVQLRTRLSSTVTLRLPKKGPEPMSRLFVCLFLCNQTPVVVTGGLLAQVNHSAHGCSFY